MNMKRCRNMYTNTSIEERIAEYGGWVIRNIEFQFTFKVFELKKNAEFEAKEFRDIGSSFSSLS